MATRRAHLYLSWLFGVVFLAIGLERALRALAIAPAPDLPAILFATILLQAIGAFAAAVCLFTASRYALIGLALFAAAFLTQMGADVLVYGVRAFGRRGGARGGGDRAHHVRVARARSIAARTVGSEPQPEPKPLAHHRPESR